MSVTFQNLTVLILLDTSKTARIRDLFRTKEDIWPLAGVDEYVVDKVWQSKAPLSPLLVCFGDSVSRRPKTPAGRRFRSTFSITRMFSRLSTSNTDCP
jgi:hypothetical protein